MQLLMGGMISGAVGTLARLGVADHLDSGPRSAEELAPKVKAEPGPLHRLMRACASVGVLAEGPDGKFSQTPLSAVLRSPGPANPGISLRGWAMFTAHPMHLEGWSCLDQCVRTGQQAMNILHGKHAFQLLGEQPDTAAVFNAAMTDLSRLDSPAIAETYSFEGIKSIVDVAGGHGLLLATILQKHPQMRGTLYEIASVIDGARSGPLVPVMDRCTLTAGDIFTSVPAGADAYMMKHIIHDWPDEPSLKILRACRTGVNPGGKLLVIDQVIQPGNQFDVGKFMDLEMLIFPGGHERTEQQFRDLYAAAGWRLNRIITTPAGISIVEGVPA